MSLPQNHKEQQHLIKRSNRAKVSKKERFFLQTVSEAKIAQRHCAQAVFSGGVVLVLVCCTRENSSLNQAGVKFFITTAIDYVNGKPHLGHAYEKVLADAIARHHRSIGDEVYFLTGVDEHGQKVEQSARTAGKAPQQFCDEMAGHFLSAWEKLNVSYDAFARTTREDHKEHVREALRKLHAQGDIVFQEHEGYYSVRQEQFVTEKDMVNGAWPEIYGEVVRMKEPNYFFRLEKYRARWIQELQQRPDWIFPDFRRNELLRALERPLDDLCISRPRSRLEWGITLPFDENFVTYVWFDALLNYTSFAAGHWPAQLQVIGKDILVPAHGVYWPIMLLALNLPLPERLLVHGWWQMEGRKMSKSTGNIVDPMELADVYGADAFRYYLLREMATGHDADFCVEAFAIRYSSDLANDLGNLINRTISMTQKYLGGCFSAGEPEPGLEIEAHNAHSKYLAAMEDCETHRALEAVWKFVRACNKYAEEKAPWKLAKDSTRSAELAAVLKSLALAGLRISLLIDAVMPVTARRIREQLGCADPLTLKDWSRLEPPKTVGDPKPLFPKVDFAGAK